MGCTNSKLDDLPAVFLCKERCTFLDDAIQQRFALAEAHVAYILSLKQIGQSLRDFIKQEVSGGTGGAGGSFSPPHKKGIVVDSIDTNPSESIRGVDVNKIRHSHSNSGSHLNFHDSDDDDLSGSNSPLHSSSPLHKDLEYDYPNNYENQPSSSSYPYPYPQPGGGGNFMNMNFMKSNKTTPSVVYQQRPISPETVHHVNDYPYQYPNSNFNFNSNSYPYQGYPNPDYGSNYYGSSSSQPPPQQQQQAASSSKPPPTPPSPPRASAWDFLNPFESYDKFYNSYTPSRDSKEVREEEGIPDLEDVDYYQHEVVKKVDSGHNKHLNFDDDDEDEDDDDDDGHHHLHKGNEADGRVSMENDGGGVEYDVHVVEKKVMDNNERGEERSNVASAAFKAGSRDVSDVAMEIEVQFVRASESMNEIASMLEVGKLQYQNKLVSKMLHVATPSLSVISSQPSTSKSAEPSSSTDKAGSAYLDNVDEDMVMRTKNLSSTLHKLYLWEKKLYNEVKAEEKMRVAHEKKCRKLKRLDERGAEIHKVDLTRTLIRNLSTKIRIAIQVVDKISVTINKIRDEELWPQLNDLIQGLTRMWKSMLECHHSQCLAIKEARGLAPIGPGKKRSDAHLEATLQFEHELLNWTFRFSNWIDAQKGYVRALNNWLLKCLLYEPEETADGIVPFSPGRIGAPPVFVICNQWSQAMDRLSEKEVIESMRMFAISVLQLREQDKLDMRHRMTTNKDLERKVRNLDREDQKIQKEIQALDKKLVVPGDGGLLVPGHVVYQSDTSSISLQGSLQRIFEAMERFTADSKKAYEELLQRSEEERVAREHERVS